MKYLIVDYRINEEEENNLLNLGYHLMHCPRCGILYDAVCGHPDMLVNLLDKKTVIVHKDMDKVFINKLRTLNIDVLLTEKSLGRSYPEDIILNAVNLDNLFMHNIKFSDPLLLRLVQGKQLINIKQGYTKCSTAIISSSAAITSDVKISKQLLSHGLDVLFLPPGDIVLPGLNYGFIGGCCGLIEENVIAFYGNLNYYCYGREVLQFLKKHKVTPVFLREGKLIDRGSIFLI